MQFVKISCPSCPKHLASLRQPRTEAQGGRGAAQGRGEGGPWVPAGLRVPFPAQQGVLGPAVSCGSGYAHSLNQCRAWCEPVTTPERWPASQDGFILAARGAGWRTEPSRTAG